MRVDYHCHTRLCKHAIGEVPQYVERAIERGIGELGFSDHMPMPAWYDPQSRMAEGEFDTYLGWVEGARRFAKGRVTIRLGLEGDYVPGTEDYVRGVIARAPFDYVIGSVHFIGDWGFDNKLNIAEWKKRDVGEVYAQYYGLIAAMARTRLFDIVGHIDVVKKFGHRPSASIDALLESTLRAVKESGMALDINTSGLRFPCREIYPSRRLLDLARAMDVPVTLGADAHRPDHVGEDFDKAAALLRDAGYSQILRYVSRRPEPVPLG